MFKRFQDILLTPRLWLAAGTISFGASVAIGYHQDQIAAQNVLTDKVDLPSQVWIQDFDTGRHSNLLSEINVLGEVALSQTATFNLGTADAPIWLQGTPIYPVGAASRPFAESHMARLRNEMRRPMPRDQKDALAREAEIVGALERQPMAIVLIEPGRSMEGTGLLASIGEGLNGPLVAITGRLQLSEQIQTAAVQAISVHGVTAMDNLPLISPYSDGVRAVGLSYDYSALRNLFEWLAVTLCLIATANAFSLFRRPVKAKPAEFQSVQAVGAFPSVFQPIMTQEDLIREEQERSEQEASATRRMLSRRVTHSAV